MSTDPNNGRSNRTDPITSAVAVTPNDGTDLTYTTRQIYIGVAGTLKVTMKDGMPVSFANIAAGWHPLCVSRVWLTGTSATGIIAGW